MARGLALVLSVGLGSLVVVNAQFGCDSPASNPPPPKDSAPSEHKPESQQKPDSEPQAEAEPPPAAPEPAAEPTAPVAAEPVFMPASKSGGDFGSMGFPGEQSPTQQQQNAAPKK